MFNLDKKEVKEEPTTNYCPVGNLKCNNVCRTDIQVDNNKRKEEIAFCLAENDGFKKDAIDYWLEAEKIVNEERRK